MGKEENLYAKEYVTHYKKLGYNHIFLYDNNDINGERFEDVIEEEIKEGFISLINYRGKRGNKEKLGGPQLEIYYDCYEKNNKNYDWLSFFDFDEFLVLRNNESIQEFFNHKRFEKCQNIKINFLYYSDNELLYYDNRNIQERFVVPLLNHSNNSVIKSTVRGRLKENYWKKTYGAHTSLMNYTSCNSEGKIISFNSFTNTPFNSSYIILKHYYTKSVEEYCNKVKRGEAFYSQVDFNYQRKIDKIKRYFSYNKETKEKIELFKKMLDLNKK